MEVKTCLLFLLPNDPLFLSYGHTFPFWSVVDCCVSVIIVGMGIYVVIVMMLACGVDFRLLLVGGRQ